MHHHNTFILNAIGKQLQNTIAGQVLVKCFSNSVDELYFEFENFAFRCLFFEGEILFSFHTEKVNENRLYKPQFQELIGQKLEEVKTHAYERSFHFVFVGNFSLFFKCYGRKSNIILYENQEGLTAFRKHIEKDTELNYLAQIHKNAPLFNAENFIDEKIFLKQYPYLPISFYKQLKSNLTQLAFDELLLKYNNLNAIQWQPNTFEINIAESQTNEIFTQINTFTNQYLKQNVLLTSKNKLLEKLQKAIAEKENYLSINTQALAQLKQKRSDEELGNIILSNIHLIQQGNKKATLVDIYNNQPIDIKLNDKLNAIDNAAQYFKKAKAKPMALKLLTDKIHKAEKELEVLKQELQAAQNVENIKGIKKIISTSNAQKINEKEETLPYKLFEIEGYTILVGKHADSNDKILSKHSDKDDVWLHVKDVGGSHVIIKTKRNTTLPNSVIEKAASLAAYYSKSRNQTLATVTYTLRKYVRKLKGAEKGLVTVSNEKTLLVKPMKFDEL